MGDANGKDTKGNNGFDFTQNHRLKSYLKTGASSDQNTSLGQAPIADLFPNTTVLFADVSRHHDFILIQNPRVLFWLVGSHLVLSFSDNNVVRLRASLLGVPLVIQLKYLFSFNISTKPLTPLRNAVVSSRSKLLGIPIWLLLDYPIHRPIMQ
jgi:hypothetical protein